MGLLCRAAYLAHTQEHAAQVEEIHGGDSVLSALCSGVLDETVSFMFSGSRWFRH